MITFYVKLYWSAGGPPFAREPHRDHLDGMATRHAGQIDLFVEVAVWRLGAIARTNVLGQSSAFHHEKTRGQLFRLHVEADQLHRLVNAFALAR